jgi:hypothetical protein
MATESLVESEVEHAPTYQELTNKLCLLQQDVNLGSASLLIQMCRTYRVDILSKLGLKLAEGSTARARWGRRDM